MSACMLRSITSPRAPTWRAPRASCAGNRTSRRGARASSCPPPTPPRGAPLLLRLLSLLLGAQVFGLVQLSEPPACRACNLGRSLALRRLAELVERAPQRARGHRLGAQLAHAADQFLVGRGDDEARRIRIARRPARRSRHRRRRGREARSARRCRRHRPRTAASPARPSPAHRLRPSTRRALRRTRPSPRGGPATSPSAGSRSRSSRRRRAGGPASSRLLSTSRSTRRTSASEPTIRTSVSFTGRPEHAHPLARVLVGQHVRRAAAPVAPDLDAHPRLFPGCCARSPTRTRARSRSRTCRPSGRCRPELAAGRRSCARSSRAARACAARGHAPAAGARPGSRATSSPTCRSRACGPTARGRPRSSVELLAASRPRGRLGGPPRRSRRVKQRPRARLHLASQRGQRFWALYAVPP